MSVTHECARLQEELDAQRRDHKAALERANAQLGAAITRTGGVERQFGQQFDADPVRAVETVLPVLTALEVTINEANATHAPFEPGSFVPSMCKMNCERCGCSSTMSRTPTRHCAGTWRPPSWNCTRPPAN